MAVRSAITSTLSSKSMGSSGGIGGGGALGTVAGCELCVSGALPPSEAKFGGMVGGGIGVVDLRG